MTKKACKCKLCKISTGLSKLIKKYKISKKDEKYIEALWNNSEEDSTGLGMLRYFLTQKEGKIINKNLLIELGVIKPEIPLIKENIYIKTKNNRKKLFKISTKSSIDVEKYKESVRKKEK